LVRIGYDSKVRDAKIRRSPSRTARAWALLSLEAIVGVAALAGGALLIAQPDGSLLAAKPSALVGTPFGDWRWPGVLLAVFVGGGMSLTAVWLWLRWARARDAAIASAVGLLVFEVVEYLVIGFQGLQVVIGALSLVMLRLAWETP
jgi:hypothetical protein